MKKKKTEVEVKIPLGVIDLHRVAADNVTLYTDITLRDLFAAAAIGGILHGASSAGIPKDKKAWLAEDAYEMADAMLNERGKK